MRKYLIFSIALISLVGCGGSPSLVGKWNMAGGTLPAGSKIVTEFAEKTYKMNVEIAQMGTTIKFAVNGDYTFDGKRIKMMGKSIDLDEASLPAALKPSAGLMKAGMEKKMLETQEGEAKLEGDTLIMMDKGKPATFTRMK